MMGLITVLLACFTASTSINALEIRDVQPSSRYLAKPGDDGVQVAFTLSEEAAVTLEIYDARDLLVRNVSSTSSLKAGRHSLVWDGTDNQQRPVPANAYRYALEARNEKKKTVRYDLSDLTGGKQMTARNVAWNEKTQTIDYSLSSDALVNIRIGLRNNGPLMKTLLDWVPRKAGKNAESWDGFDASGVINLAKHALRDIAVTAYSLSDNSVIVDRDRHSTQWLDVSAWGQQKRPQSTKSKKPIRKSNPYHQAADTRGDVAIQLALKGDAQSDDEGLPTVQGKVPFVLDMAEKDKKLTLDRRFEAAFFVDGIKVFENEIGFLPMTWYWDASATNPGIHYITANLIGYEGNFAMQTIKLRVLPAEGKKHE